MSIKFIDKLKPTNNSFKLIDSTDIEWASGDDNKMSPSDINLDVYSKSEIDSRVKAIESDAEITIAKKISEAGLLSRIILAANEELPTGNDIKQNVIYMKPETDSAGKTYYVEYIRTDSSWEKLGDSDVRLDNYLSLDGGTFNSGYLTDENGKPIVDSTTNKQKTGAVYTISNVRDPREATEVATKNYVDNSIAVLTTDGDSPVVIKSEIQAYEKNNADANIVNYLHNDGNGNYFPGFLVKGDRFVDIKGFGSAAFRDADEFVTSQSVSESKTCWYEI